MPVIMGKTAYQFHTTGLTSAVFFSTVLSKVSPFPALAGHLVGIVEAHFCSGWTPVSLVTQMGSHLKLGIAFNEQLTGCE
jgi:hypothetical protein